MTAVNTFKITLYALLLSGIMLNSGHAEPTSDHDQTILQRSTLTPQRMPDGSIRIEQKHLTLHIGTPGVFILSENNRARFRMVKAGKSIGRSVEIISGLSGNEKILSGPYDSLFDGSPVRETNTRMEKQL